MRQIKKIIGGMLCCVLITGLFSVPVDASKKKAATTDTETTETDTTKRDDKDKKETSTTTTRVTSSAKPKDGEISKVIVESYEIEGDTSPGDEFTIKVTIQNTSSQFDAKDIVGFMYFPNGGLYIQNGEANEKFCAVLAPGETTVLEYKLGVAETCLDDTALIELDIDYFSNNNANVTNANFTPAIVQSGDLSIDLLSVAKSVENGTKLLVSTRYENKGEKDIKKVIMHVTGSVKGGKADIKFDEIDAGKVQTKEGFVELEGSGMQQIKVYFSYEDSKGNHYKTKEQTFKVEITQKGVKESKSRIKKFIDEISNPFCLTMIAAAVVCLVIVLLFVLDKSHKSKLSKRKKREERKIVMNNKRLIEIDVRRCFKALKTHLSWIFMSAILFLAIGIVFALATEEKQDMYKASSSVYCITEGGDYSATYDSTKLMMTYAEIGKSQTVLERANQIMGNRYESTQDILDLVDIDYDESAVIESALLRVNAVGPDKDEVVEVANAVAEAFVIEMSNITENGDARILDKAKFAEKDVNAQKNILKVVGIFAIGGAVLMCIYLVLREIFSNKLVTVKDGTLYGKINIIGVIPDFNNTDD